MVTSIYFDRIQDVKGTILCIGTKNADPYNRHLDDELDLMGWHTFLAIKVAAVKAGQDFIQSICATVEKYQRVSEKQAYCLARFATDQKMVFDWDPEDFAEYGFED